MLCQRTWTSALARSLFVMLPSTRGWRGYCARSKSRRVHCVSAPCLNQWWNRQTPVDPAGGRKAAWLFSAGNISLVFLTQAQPSKATLDAACFLYQQQSQCAWKTCPIGSLLIGYATAIWSSMEWSSTSKSATPWELWDLIGERCVILNYALGGNWGETSQHLSLFFMTHGKLIN